MKFHYDVTAAEPIIRDIRVYNVGALTMGTAMCHGAVATAENMGCATVSAPTTSENVIGVLNENLTAAEALSVVASGTDKYGKIVINPLAVWLAEYSMLAADDCVTTTTTPKVLTCGMVVNHHRGWAYVTNVGSTTGGYGNLFQIGAGSTSAATAATAYDDYLTDTEVGDTFIVMPAPYSADVAGGGINLAANSINISGYLEAAVGEGSVMVLENYISSKARPIERLVCAQHSGNNYRAEAPKFFADIMFPEHLLCGGGAITARVIT